VIAILYREARGKARVLQARAMLMQARPRSTWRSDEVVEQGTMPSSKPSTLESNSRAAEVGLCGGPRPAKDRSVIRRRVVPEIVNDVPGGSRTGGGAVVHGRESVQ